MKKTVTMLLLAAMMTAACASCGQVDEPSVGNGRIEDSSAAEDESAVTEEAEEDSEEPEVTTEPEEPEPEEETVTTAEIVIPDRTEPNMSYHDWLMQSMELDAELDGYSVRELMQSMGLANVYDEGKAYALVPDSGGAGHAYYKVYHTEDYGESWTEGEFYDEINGDNRHFALEDGGIMLFSMKTARAETYPIVTYLYYDGGEIRSVELREFLSQNLLSDGRMLSEVSGVDYEITYRYEDIFDIIVTDSESGEILGEMRDLDLRWAKAYALEDELTDISE